MEQFDSSCRKLYGILQIKGILGFNKWVELSGLARSTALEHVRHLRDNHQVVFQNESTKEYSLKPTAHVLTSKPPLITLTTTITLTIHEAILKYKTASRLFNQSTDTKHIIPMFVEDETAFNWKLLNPVIKFGNKIIYNKDKPPHFETQNDNTLKYFLNVDLKPQATQTLSYQYDFPSVPYFFTTITLFKKELIFTIHDAIGIRIPLVVFKQVNNKFESISPNQINPSTYNIKETLVPANTTYYVFWDQKELQKFKKKIPV